MVEKEIAVNQRFTWIPVYEAIADALYKRRDDRDSVLSIVRKVFIPHGSEGKESLPYNGSETSYRDIDPFTAMGTFNRSGRDATSPSNISKRLVQIGKWMTELGLGIPQPADLDGVPTNNYQHSWFFEGGQEAVDRGDVDRLWSAFDAAIEYADNKDVASRARFVEAYDSVSSQKQMGNGLPTGLFWARPRVYLPLDFPTRRYLDAFGIDVVRTPSASEYLQLLEEVAREFPVAFPEVSEKAYEYDGWWPPRDLYDPGVSPGRWAEVLRNPEVFGEDQLITLNCLCDCGGEATTAELRNKYGRSERIYADQMDTIGKRLMDSRHMNGKALPEVSGKYLGSSKHWKNCRYWPALVLGQRKSGRGQAFVYKLRPELAEALEQFDFSDVPLYDGSSAGVEHDKQEDAEAPMSSISCVHKNIILYGPPGTGKTYQAKAYAVGICDGRRIDDVLEEMESSEGYKKISDRYAELVGKEKRIGFVTFHQSYSYEDFIEGMRPSYDNELEVMDYPVEDGVFQGFCRRAQNADASVSSTVPRYEDNPNPHVWKLGLNADNVRNLYGECKREGCIRIGWDTWGPDEYQNADDISSNNKRALHIFQEEMQLGDLVVTPSYGSGGYHVAVITGEFEWREDLVAAKRCREVRWLNDISKRELLDMNGGKTLTLQTAYELSRIDYMGLLEGLGLAPKAEERDGREGKPYVFIIDEINRGNISKIFGELITLLEEDKRGGAREAMSVELPYSKRSFSVPSNVYVIGTMNTADRSIALMDTALRRRFSFIEVMPDPSLLEDIHIEDIDLVEMMRAMNKRIEVLYDREHTIGHAYLLPLRDDPTVSRLARIFKDRIIPLLQEYFYDDYGKIRSVLGAAASEFIEVQDASGVFWADDDRAPSDAEIFRLKETPETAGPYKMIYQAEAVEG